MAPREVATHVQDTIRSFADFDGDGRLDVVVTRAHPTLSGITSFWIGFATADGSYVPGPTIPAFPTGYQADEYALAGDVTGDGLPDVVTSLRELTSNPGSGILLYRNLGGGTLAAPVHTPGAVPWANGILTDWNRDGVHEVVEVHIGTGTGGIRRWTYQGGGFVGSNEVLTPNYVSHITTGEVTGDGLPDIVAGSADDNRIFIAPTLPGGGLGPMVTLTVGLPSIPYGRVPGCGDVDGDGDQDIVVGWPTYQVGSNFAVITHDGLGGLTVGAPQLYSAQPGTYWDGRAHVVDWDGDGDGDLLFGHELLYLIENQGSAGMRLASALRVNRTSASPLAGNDGVGSADFDRDGNPDFAIGRVLVHGTRRFEPAFLGQTISSVQQPVDWDGDGDLDLLESGGELSINLGGNTFATPQELFPALPPQFFYTEAYACGDFTGDGRLDLLVTYRERVNMFQVVFHGMHLLEGGADGVLRDRGLAGPAATNIGTSATFPVVQRDLDGDNDVDVAVTGGWWENAGGAFQVFHPAWTGHPQRIVDMNGDGRPDVLAVEVGTSPTVHRLFRNQGGGTFVGEILASDPALTYTARGELSDLDDDGDLDFAVGLTTGPTPGPVVVLRENQGGVFMSPVTITSRDRAFELLLFDDFDGDGRTDLAAAPASANGYFGDSALVWRRTGPGLVYAAPRAWLMPEPLGGRADLDGDGDPDLYGRQAIVGSGRWQGLAAGRYAQYGTSQAGPSGVAPVLGLRGPARAGSAIELRVRRAPGAGVAILALGPSSADLPNVPLPGLTLRVLPVIVTLALVVQGNPGVPGSGAATLPIVVPPDLRGVRIFHQAFVLDGLSLGATNGLEIEYGR